MATLIRNARVVRLDSIQTDSVVEVRDGTIRRIGRSGSIEPTDHNVVDAGGRYLAPGFIDMHIHGVHDRLVDAGADRVAGMCEILPRYGVTGFLPTIVPPPPGADTELIAGIAELEPSGTQILGIFFEGPYLGHPGAIPKEAMGKPDASRVERLIEAANGVPLVFAVAPEVPGVVELIPTMGRSGTPVFITHSSATVEQGQAAIEAGARHGTHFYDVFPCRDVEDPGVRPCSVVEALLADPRASVDFILDGEHVHPVAVQMALECKGPDRVCLITDANLGAGYPPGVYKGLGDTDVEFAYDGAPARMTRNTRIPGSLAGSGLTMNRAVRNAVNMLNVGVPLAVRMASANPAQVLGVHDRKGRIEEGYDADLVLLNDDFTVAATWAGGRQVWAREA